jgi:hypothetical protein
MTAFRDTDEFKRGSTGERIVATYLQKRGYYVIPSYDYSGNDGDKAPKLQGLLHSHVIPDLDIAKGGKRKWCEVKTKRAATWTRITQQWEHGIPKRHLDAYLQVEAITGTDVFLVVYEESTGVLLRISAKQIADTGRESEMKKSGYSQGPMVYFARDAMLQIGTVPAPTATGR